jgi:hypothetical protein
VSAAVDEIRSSISSDQFAALSDTPLNSGESICHGRAVTFGGLEKN